MSIPLTAEHMRAQDLLAMVPQPVLAVLMLFPITDASEKTKAEEDARLRVRRCPLPLRRALVQCGTVHGYRGWLVGP